MEPLTICLYLCAKYTILLCQNHLWIAIRGSVINLYRRSGADATCDFWSIRTWGNLDTYSGCQRTTPFKRFPTATNNFLSNMFKKFIMNNYLHIMLFFPAAITLDYVVPVPHWLTKFWTFLTCWNCTFHCLYYSIGGHIYCRFLFVSLSLSKNIDKSQRLIQFS